MPIKSAAPPGTESLGGHRVVVVGSILLVAQPFVLSAMSLFAAAYIIRTLGPSQYGYWATAASLTAATAMMANLGLPPLFVRALCERPEERPRLLAEQLAVRFGLGCVAALVAVFAAVALRYPAIVVRCAVISGAALMLQSIWMVFGDYLQAQERFQTLAAVSLASGLQLTTLAIIAVSLGGGPVGLALAYLAGPLFSVMAFAWLLHRRKEIVAPRVSWGRAKQLITESGSIAAAQVMAGVRDRGEQLMLPKVVGHARFGLFVGSLMPAERLNVIADAIGTAMYPRMSRASGDARYARTAALVIAVAVASATAGALLYLAAPAIVRILFPAEGTGPVRLVRITSLGLPAGGLAVAFTYALQAAGHYRAAARLSIVSSVISLAIVAPLVLTWGTYGAAAAWVTRQMLFAGLLLPSFWRHLHSPHLPAARLGAVVTALAGAAWLLGTDDPSLFTLAERAFVVLVLSAASIFTLRVSYTRPAAN